MGGEPIEVTVSQAYVYWMGLVHRLLGLKMKELQTFETFGEYIANNTLSYCNTAMRSSNVAMDGVSRHDRIEVMSVKVRSSMRHKSNGRSYAYVYCMPSQRMELFSVSASNGFGRYIVYALDK